MQHIYQVIREIDPLQFEVSLHEYNNVIQEMNDQFLKEKDGKFKKYIVFESFQKLFWEGACDDLKCTEISDKINERIENKTLQNFCTDCGIDMGDCNPRQLCGKRMCMDENYVF